MIEHNGHVCTGSHPEREAGVYGFLVTQGQLLLLLFLLLLLTLLSNRNETPSLGSSKDTALYRNRFKVTERCILLFDGSSRTKEGREGTHVSQRILDKGISALEQDIELRKLLEQG